MLQRLIGSTWGRLPLAAIIVCMLLAPALVSVHANERTLREQLHSLAVTEGFKIAGLERIGDELTPRPLGNDPVGRLRILLQSYSYVVAYDAEGKITEIWVLERHPLPEAKSDQFRIESTRIGPHHLVEATLVGPTGAWRKLSLIVDTGATNVVLPSSMISQLDFGDTNLSDGWAETAGGRVKAKSGRLASVMVGQAMAQDVAVTFIDDELIGEKALLGMSFLSHFRLTIEEPGDGIILMAR